MLKSSQKIPYSSIGLIEDLLTRDGYPVSRYQYPFEGMKSQIDRVIKDRMNNKGTIDESAFELDINDFVEYLKTTRQQLNIRKVKVNQDTDIDEDDERDINLRLEDLTQAQVFQFVKNKLYAYMNYNNSTIGDTYNRSYKELRDEEGKPYNPAMDIVDSNFDEEVTTEEEVAQNETKSLLAIIRYLYLCSIECGVHLISFAFAYRKCAKACNYAPRNFAISPLYLMKGEIIWRRVVHEDDNKNPKYYPKWRDLICSRDKSKKEVRAVLKFIELAEKCNPEIFNCDPSQFDYDTCINRINEMQIDNSLIDYLLDEEQDEKNAMNTVLNTIADVTNNMDDFMFIPISEIRMKNILSSFFIDPLTLDFSDSYVKTLDGKPYIFVCPNGNYCHIIFTNGLVVEYETGNKLYTTLDKMKEDIDNGRTIQYSYYNN